jgi:exonuclease SbcD
VLRILHFADLHLDRTFTGLGMTSGEATRRREELRSALRRIVDVALALDVDAVTVGGDLYEHDRLNPDTGRFIAGQFARLAPRPVLIAPGNHDPYVPNSPYCQLDWVDNVHIFDSMTWTSKQLTAGVTLWGVGHNGPAVDRNLLQDLRLDRSRTHIALLHGSDVSAGCVGPAAYCPFKRSDVERSGAAFLLLGHDHTLQLWSRNRPRYAYPGSPEPLGFYTEGPHYVLVLTVDRGAISVEPLQINQVRYRTEQIDVTGLSTTQELCSELRRLAARVLPGDIVRVRLVGHVDPAVRLDVGKLRLAAVNWFRYVEIVNETGGVAISSSRRAGQQRCPRDRLRA